LSKNSVKSFVSATAGLPPKPALISTRRWPRHRLAIPVRVIVHTSDVHTSDRTKLYDGQGNELKEGGMAVTAGVELTVGREVAVEFTPPFSGIPIRVGQPYVTAPAIAMGSSSLWKVPRRQRL
jgi:hypothetical protein